MSENKYTQGPWIVCEYDGYYGISMLADNSGHDIRLCFDSRKQISKSSRQSAMCMIAAAPDLLDACENTLHWLDEIGPECNDCGVLLDAMRDAITRAIAKTKGGEK